MCDISNSRDVTIVSHPAKLFGGLRGQKMLPKVSLLTPDTQCGDGLNGGETGLVHLALKSSEHIFLSQGMCSVTLFAGIVGA